MTVATSISSVSSPVAFSTGAKPGGAGILRVQLSRYQSQLADWCNCPSGKTSEGKKIIDDLQQKADAAQAALKRAEDSRSASAASPAIAINAPTAPDGATGPATSSSLDVLA